MLEYGKLGNLLVNEARRFGLVLSLVAGLATGHCTTAEEYTFTTFAGVRESGAGFFDGQGNAARFRFPSGTIADKSGNLYLADYGNHTIRKITAAGMVMTLAGLAGESGSADGLGAKARFRNPQSLTIDPNGNFFVADTGNNVIRKITPNGQVTTIAGLANNSGSTDGPGRSARFFAPSSLIIDSNGFLFVSDTENQTIRKISPEGIVSTFAGTAGERGSADGTGSAARFNFPQGLTLDAAGNLYVADTDNHIIRKITPNAVVTKFAGSPGISGADDGPVSAAKFFQPSGLSSDGAGVLYITDSGNSTIRRIISGNVSTLAGTAKNPGSADGVGPAAQFNYPVGLTSDGKGNVYVADTYNHVLRIIGRGGSVRTVAGLAAVAGTADGPEESARFKYPNGISMDEAGTIYVADSGNHVIRKVTHSGVVSTFAGQAGSAGTADLVGSAARFNFPVSLSVDSAGNVYVADTQNNSIRKITPTGAVSTLAGLSGSPGVVDGVGASARFQSPSGVTVDTNGTVYVADTWNHTIRKITAAGVVTTIAGVAGSTGTQNGIGTDARFYFPEGIAVDLEGNIYVVDNGNLIIRKITPQGSVSTLAGSPGVIGSDDGLGTAARFNLPFGLAIDTSGNLFVADTINQIVRMVSPAGLVTTLGGGIRTVGGTDGNGNSARFSAPSGIVVDRNGQLYIADSANHCIRKGTKTLPDSPTCNPPIANVGTPRLLDVSNPSFTSWLWSFVRYPANSSAQLSSPTERNPSFVPDVDDLYLLRMQGFDQEGRRAFGTLSVQLDTDGPTLTIVSPSSGDISSQPLLTVLGTAHDNNSVAEVRLQVNDSQWLAAQTTNAWTNWSIILPLNSGANLIRAFAIDQAGNNSTTNELSIISQAGVVFRLSTSPSQSAGTLDFTVEAPNGATGHVELSDDLRTWTHITDFTSTGAPLNYRDSTLTNFSKRFYRAILQ